ncbi:hypothetical protein HYS94_03900 [Candidatus Daviesbacteria bacterium]|nr:hypothetical protein [Candidatus Daviesbacteria bacterium]
MVNPENQGGLNKREFFQLLPKVALGVTMVPIVTNEVMKVREGISTPYANFYPIYIRHDQDLEIHNLPPNLTVLFSEMMIQGGNFALDYASALTTWSRIDPPISKPEATRIYFKRILPDELLLNLAKSGTSLALGDIYLPEGIVKSYFDLIKKEFVAGGAISLFWAIGTRFNLKLSEGLNIRLPRRNLISGAIYGSSLWAILPYLGGISLPYLMDKPAALKRIMIRLEGLESNLHPELIVTFLRNLMMGNNSLTIGEHLLKDSGIKPVIGFKVGAGHSGIEDFLQAGHDICRMLIKSMPRELLQTLINENGGIENFCSARLIKLPEDLSPDDFWYRNNLPLRIIDQRITDYTLQELLTNKLQ